LRRITDGGGTKIRSICLDGVLLELLSEVAFFPAFVDGSPSPYRFMINVAVKPSVTLIIGDLNPASVSIFRKVILLSQRSSLMTLRPLMAFLTSFL
jgi:hypothetical protein